MVEVGQVGGIVREVGVHLDDVLIVAPEGPFEAVDIGCAEPHLAAAALQIDPAWVLLHLAAHGVGCAVGRTVVDYEQVEAVGKRHYGVDHSLDVLYLVVGGYDNKYVAHS